MDQAVPVTRAVAFRDDNLAWALRKAAAWLDFHYSDGEPQAIVIDHTKGELEDGTVTVEDGWFVQVFCDV